AQKIVRLQRDIVALALEDTPIFESAKEKVLLLDEEISQKELDIRSTLNKIQELKTRKEHVQHIKLRIENLNSCPTCLQDVSPMHKHTLVDKSSREIHAFEQGIILQEEQRKILEDAQKKMRKEIELLKKKEHEMQLVALKVRQLQEKKEECVLLEKKKIGMEQTIQELTMRIVTLQTQMESFNALEILYPQIRTALDSAEQEYKKVEIEKHRGETTLQLLMQQVHVLADNIQKKKLVLEKKEHLNQVQFWLSDSFIPMVETIERNIMLKVHSDFNALFEKWFTLLVDTQTLHIALDEEFTPKILQDGYDTEYTSLSGGEKTAAALAYRLALNQIINSLNAGIKTNDLLILDEPTDGFSPEQLDRLRILMDELRIPQIILVSHEPQIESFVRTVLRFEKAGNETRLI
ncbi:MAG TPA: AAA family ATPase, partial [Candidatus Nanoarchaeia archaeon]|nr:AAA family ATPase [Candidatus Nanoarchaeia archaeon]